MNSELMIYVSTFAQALVSVMLTLTKAQQFTVKCSETWLQGIWSKSQFQGNISIVLNDPQCNDFTGTNDTHMWVQTNFAQCGCIATQMKDAVKFSNTAILAVTSPVTSLVSRESYYLFDINCKIPEEKRLLTKYSNNLNLTSRAGGDAFPPIPSPVNVTKEDFLAQIRFYTNRHYVEPAFSPIAVSTSESMYIGISEQTGKRKYKFTVSQCVLIPSNNVISTFALLYQGCVVNPKEMKILPTVPSWFRFSLITGKSISLAHGVILSCQIYICHYNDTSPGCLQHCSHDPLPPDPPSDPSAPSHAHPDHHGPPVSSVGPLMEAVISTPLVIFERKVTCKEKVCGPNASCKELFPAVCMCDTGFIWNRLTQVCEQVIGRDGKMAPKVTVIDNVVLDKPFIQEYSNTSSKEFQQLVRDAEEQLSYYISIKNDTSIVGLKVTGARQGSVILEVTLLRNTNVSAKEGLESFVEAVIINRTELVKSDQNSTSVKPKFLGISIKINDNAMPRLAAPAAATTPPTVTLGAVHDEDGDTLLMAIVIPCMVILVICFVVLVVVLQRRTSNHYFFVRM